MPCVPSNGLRIPPAFVADRDTESQGTRLETRGGQSLVCRCPLRRGRPGPCPESPANRSVLIDNQDGRYKCAVNKAFRSENDGDGCLHGCFGDDGPSVLEELGIGRRHGFAYSSVAGNEAFRKADDPCPLDGGLIDVLPGERIDSAGVAGNLTATQAGMILGTAAYMSPEQAKGNTVDRRADIWAFGGVLCQI